MILTEIEAKIEGLYNNFSRLSYREASNSRNEVNSNLTEWTKDLYVYDNMKKNHPFLSFMYYNVYEKFKIGNKEKHPFLHAIFPKFLSRQTEENINSYKEQFETKDDSEKSIEIGQIKNIIYNKINKELGKEGEKNYRRLWLLNYILGVIYLKLGDNKLADKRLEQADYCKRYSNIEWAFGMENLKETLKNPNLTDDEIKNLSLILCPTSDSNGTRIVFEYDFVRKYMDNLKKLEDIEKQKPEEVQNYILLANLSCLRGFFHSNRRGYGEAKNLFNEELYYRNRAFCLNKEQILEFIKSNYLEPRLIREKIKSLGKTIFNREKLFEIIYNNIEDIEKNNQEEIISKNELAGLKFFKANVIELMSSPDQRKEEYFCEYLNCVKFATENYYDFLNEEIDDEIKSNKAKIACLSVLNILNKDILYELDNNENSDNKNNSDYDNNFINRFVKAINLSKEKILNFVESRLPSTNESAMAMKIYNHIKALEDINAQYECGIYMKKTNQEIAINHLENAALNGHNKAKLKLIDLYLASDEIIKKNEASIIASTIPDKYYKNVAQIFEKHGEYSKAIEFYDKTIKEQSDNEKNILENRKLFMKIGNCFTKIGDSIRNLFLKNRKERSKQKEANEYYEKAINNYRNSEVINGKEFLTLESRWKIADSYRKMGNFKECKSILIKIAINLNTSTNEEIKNKSESEIYYIRNTFHELALIYDFGRDGEEIDEVSAFKYYKRAADLGDMNSMYKVGCYLKNGITVNCIMKKSELEALKYFKEAANLGDVNSMYEIGNLFYHMNNTEIDNIGINQEEVLEYLKKATSLGYPEAKELLIDVYVQKVKNNENKKEINNLEKFFDSKEDKLVIVEKLKDNQCADKAFEYYMKLGTPEYKFKAAEVLAKKENRTKKDNKKIIPIFEDLAINSDNKDIKADSKIWLGIIFSEQNDKKNLICAINCFEMGLEEYKKLGYTINDEVREKFEVAQAKLKSIVYSEQLDVLENSNSITDLENIAYNSENKSIRAIASLKLGDILSEKNDETSLNRALDYYSMAKSVYKKNKNKLNEIEARIIRVGIKKDVSRFNEFTTKQEITNVLENTADYLTRIDVNSEEKKEKLNEIVNTIRLKVLKRDKMKFFIGKVFNFLEKRGESLEDQTDITVQNKNGELINIGEYGHSLLLEKEKQSIMTVM